MYHDTSPFSLSSFYLLTFLCLYIFISVRLSSVFYSLLPCYSLSLFLEVSRKVFALIKCRTDLGMTDVFGVASLQSNCLDRMLDKSGKKDKTQGFVGFLFWSDGGQWDGLVKAHFLDADKKVRIFTGLPGDFVCRFTRHNFFLTFNCITNVIISILSLIYVHVYYLWFIYFIYLYEK
jgi:hypothetical protein